MPRDEARLAVASANLIFFKYFNVANLVARQNRFHLKCPVVSTETPSINRVLPAITPNNFLLTSRGRVVYGLLTIDKLNDATNEYLSDEFRQAMVGKALKYSESDVEKVSRRQTCFNFDPQPSRRQKSDRKSSESNQRTLTYPSAARTGARNNNILTHKTEYCSSPTSLFQPHGARAGNLSIMNRPKSSLLKLNKFPFLVYLADENRYSCSPAIETVFLASRVSLSTFSRPTSPAHPPSDPTTK